MSPDTLSRWIAIGANLGVIAGIVFLALEIQQNSEMLEAQVRAERTTSRLRPSELLANNPHLAQALYKGRAGEPLTDEQLDLLNVFYNYTMTSWEYLWKEYEAGLLAREDLGIDGKRRLFRSFPGLSERWPVISDLYHPGFVAWVEENVVN
jgi:hypothetical protein